MSEGGIGVSTVVFADHDRGVKVFEEGKGGVVNIEVVLGFPLRYSIVEKLSSCCGDEIPGESVEIEMRIE